MQTKKLLKTIYLIASVALGACNAQTHTVNSSLPKLYIGTYSKGIYMAQFDTVTGQLHQSNLVAKMINPSYLNISSSGQWLLSISEHGGRGANAYCFQIQSNGALTLTDSLEYAGEGACHISETNTDHWVISNYNSGNVAFTSIDDAGHFSKAQVFQHTGKGTDPNRQESPHVHSALMDAASQNVYVADLGIDKLVVYHPKGDSMACVDTVAVEPGAGPRHFDFHPKGKMMALLNELNHTIDIMLPDSNGVYSQRHQTVNIIEDSLSQGSTSADIHFSPDGKFLYASNRGYNCLVAFAVNQTDHVITPIDTITEKISRPRNFVISPDGQFLLVANQDGNNVVVFQRNQENGLLTLSGYELAVESPVCLKFAE